MKILVTGASGFIGRSIVATLKSASHTVRTAGFSSNNTDFRIALGPDADWSAALSGCDAVVHAGGRAHVLNRLAAQDVAAFHLVNTAGTLTLARAAVNSGVRQMVFISSIAALGDGQPQPLRESDIPYPSTAYGQSKLAAEQRLAQIQGLSVTALRPPLVYGPDAGGRFRQMLRWCDRGLPLPFGGIENERSYLAVEYLADAVRAVLTMPERAGGVFHLADDGTLSTPELLRLIGDGLGKPARLFAVPHFALQTMRRVGLAQPIDKLSQSLVLDTSKFRQRFNWVPPVKLRDGIFQAANDYRARKGG
jgi:nucleoside-diphosphate-sugar epimerase